ncbi:zinc finger BED domain-containing protein 4 [Rhipicephalus sanguineus]|uniref:zinc finger BED domain-containing protein 4 n=1 Tax=Rhipicephalus sanguineus TaxID=34632 RepID=UPI001895414D|nr:zinc finger BED domain-containing protein 4 [Rhipicephalus sanguineus]
MKRGTILQCGTDQGGILNDPVTHYVLFQPEIGTQETRHTSDIPGDDAVYVVTDSPEPSGTVTTEEWLSASGSLSECSTTEQTANHVKMKKKHSFVWEHFERHTLDKCSQVCKHCNKSVRLGKEGGCSKLGTTAMRRHLQIHHAQLLPGVSPRASVVRTKKSRAADSASDIARTSGSKNKSLDRKSKRQFSSSVWQHFDYNSSDRFLVVCKICRMQVRLGKDGGCNRVGTTAMHKHVTIHHKFLLQKNPALGTREQSRSRRSQEVSCNMTKRSPVPPTVAAVHHKTPEAKSDSCGPHHLNSVALNHCLAMYIANSIQPFSFAEEPAFLEFMHCCVPQWKVPKKSYFADCGVPALATMIKEAVRKDLKTCVGGTVHLGTETWQGPHMFDLVSVTAFWVKTQEPEQNLVRCKAVLDVVNLGESCTVENVNQALETAIKDWLLPAELRVGHVITERLPSEALCFAEMQLKHVTCMAHCLNFEVENLLFTFHSKLGDSFEVARSICSQLCRSEAARAKLKVIQSHHNLKQRPLVPDSPTNWKSTLRMLKHFCEQKLAVNEYLKVTGGISISPEQWLVLRDAASVLQPVEEVVRLLSMDSAMLGQVLPLLCFAEKMLQSTLERSERGSPAHWLSAHLLSKLSSSSHVTAVKADLTYWTASFLDPRFRDTFCSYIGGDEVTAEQKLNKVKKHLIVKIRETYMHTTKSLYVANTDKLPYQDETAPSLDEDFSLWLTNAEQMGLTRSKAEVSSDSTDIEGAAAAKFELEAYMQDSIADFSAPMSDPALYWQTKRMIWPSLYTVAVTYLACPPTNTYSERMFEKYGAVASEGRQGICADTLSLFCFIRMNHNWVPKDISDAPADVIDSLRNAMDKGNTDQYTNTQFVDADSEVLLKRVIFQD